MYNLNEKRGISNFNEVVFQMFKEEEGLNITNCVILNHGEYELDYCESCGGGFSNVGSFKVPAEELYERVDMFLTKPIRFARSEIVSAIDTSWNQKKRILIYPKDMNLIIVDFPREEHCYLTKTHIIETDCFDSKKDFEYKVKELVLS